MKAMARKDASVSDRLLALLTELTSDEGPTRSTVMSVRMPPQLQEAMRLAAEAGLIPSVNDALVQANLQLLESLVRDAALDDYFAAHPERRPTLARLARAAAVLVDDPNAGNPALIDRAAAEIVKVKADATVEDVLTWARAIDVFGPEAKVRTRGPRAS